MFQFSSITTKILVVLAAVLSVAVVIVTGAAYYWAQSAIVKSAATFALTMGLLFAAVFAASAGIAWELGKGIVQPALRVAKRFSEMEAENLTPHTVEKAIGSRQQEVVQLSQTLQRTRSALASAYCLVHDMACRDTLTHLPNRRMFEEELERRLTHAARYPESMAIVLLDLDKFRQVNDALGHVAGDMVLKEISRRLLAAVRTSDCVARLGGDEFLIVLSHVADREILDLLMNRILNSCSEPIFQDEQQVCVCASIGVSLYPQDGKFVIDLIRKADMAMYHSKSRNGNTYTCYGK